MNENRTIASSENQVLKYLFQYISTLDLGLPIYLEYLPKDIDALAMKVVSTACKKRCNILGGFETSMPFAIIGSTTSKDADPIYQIVQAMNEAARIFERETNEKFPNLSLGDYIPLKLEMLTTPGTDENKSDSVIFKAHYQLTYLKK